MQTKKTTARAVRNCYAITVLITLLLLCSYRGNTQTITLTLKNAPLQKVLNEVEKQTGFTFFFNRELLKEAKPVTVNAKNTPLAEFLEQSLKGQAFEYRIKEKYIILSRTNNRKEGSQPSNEIATAQNNDEFQLSGIVLDDKTAQPVNGASVFIKGSTKGAITNETGSFTMHGVPDNAAITISMIGYTSITFPASRQEPFQRLRMKIASNELDQAVVQAYGITSKRLSTGNITKIKGEDISQQPVLNPLLALEGRVAGLVITPLNGHASAPVKIELRGRNSVNQNFPGDPLIIIDGLPQTILEVGTILGKGEVNSRGIAQGMFSNTGGQSPLYGLNPGDIESIEVLKDGDATAIYGSRGANGVILITTKKPKPGKTTFTASVSQGVDLIARKANLLNTQQYLEVRREAFRNDGITPNFSNAPDLTLYDTSRYTDWQRELAGTGTNTVANIQISGGDAGTSFRISANYNTKKTSTQTSGKDEIMGGLMSIKHSGKNQKLSIELTAGYKHTFTDAIKLNGGFTLPPNAPAIFDSTGKPNYAAWTIPGTDKSDYPFATLFQPANTNSNLFNTSFIISYQLIKGLRMSATIGYGNSRATINTYIPILSQNPVTNPTGQRTLSITNNSNWSMDPQLDFSTFIGKGRMNIVAGATLQSVTTDIVTIVGQGYTNDEMLHSLANAPSQFSDDNYAKYKYAGLFGRISYHWDNRISVNLNARRDGSSRFAPGKRYGNFASIGAAWILSEEKWFSGHLPNWISFVKLRSSYGITGSDRIGDYQYLSQWGINTSGLAAPPYNTVPAFAPVHAVNQRYHWESNRKFEAALEMAFLKERLNISIARYRHLSNEQLIRLATPVYTGFPNVYTNSNARVENSGVEFSIGGTVLKNRDFSWGIGFNTGFNRNRLLSYPGLESSTHASTYKTGYALNSQFLLHYLGIDPLTGNPSFEDYNGDGKIITQSNAVAGSGQDDRYVVMNRNPKFQGGFSSNFKYNNFSLNLNFSFAKENGLNPFLATIPGKQQNLYLPEGGLNNYWRKPGDNAKYPRLSTLFADVINASQSDGALTDASYIRCTMLTLAYSLPEKWCRKNGMGSCSFSINTNNLFIITSFPGLDPQIPNIYGVYPPRTINGSLQITF